MHVCIFGGSLFSFLLLLLLSCYSIRFQTSSCLVPLILAFKSYKNVKYLTLDVTAIREMKNVQYKLEKQLLRGQI